MVSIIVPVYKVEKYINKCIESILAQTYKDFELILVDDGSPDNSGAICDEYAKKDSRIKVIHKQNGGVSSARNSGIESAKGEFINFVDSDDTIPYDSLENLIKLQKENDADLVCCTYDAYREDKLLGKVSFYDCFIDFSSVKPSASKVFLSNSLSGPCTKLYRKSILKDNDISFDVKIPVGEDAIFVYTYLAKCKNIQCGNVVVYHYLKNDQSASTKAYEEFVNYVTNIVTKKTEFYKSLNLGEIEKSCYSVCATICSFASVVNHYLEHYNLKKTIEVTSNFYEQFKTYFLGNEHALVEFLVAHNEAWYKPYNTYKVLTSKNGVEKYCKTKLKQKRVADFKKGLKKIKILNKLNDFIKGRK